MAKDRKQSRQDECAPRTGGLAGWLIERFGRAGRARPRLMLLERISLAPRQTLALVEAEGRRFLVATSTDGAPCFYPLEVSAAGPGKASSELDKSHLARRPTIGGSNAARISW